MKKYLVALDQGTTSSRAIVFDRSQQIVASAQKEADDILAAAKAESDRTIGTIEANRKAEELRYEKARAAAAEYIQKVRMLLDREQTFLTTLAEADLTGAVVTPAPAEKKAIAAPAEAAESETVEEEVLPAAEPEAEPEAEPKTEEEESPLYPDAEDEQDYVKAFENAVYQKPEDSDTDAPEIKF